MLKLYKWTQVEQEFIQEIGTNRHLISKKDPTEAQKHLQDVEKLKTGST